MSGAEAYTWPFPVAMEVAALNSSITEFIVFRAKILHHLPDLDSRQMYEHILDEITDYLSLLN